VARLRPGRNHIDSKANVFDGDLGVVLAAAFCPTVLDCNITAFDPAEFAQPLRNPHSHGVVHQLYRGTPIIILFGLKDRSRFYFRERTFERALVGVRLKTPTRTLDRTPPLQRMIQSCGRSVTRAQSASVSGRGREQTYSKPL
jgi:hypothetical protein